MTKGSTEIAIPLNRKALAVNDQVQNIDTVAVVDSATNRTYLPLRYVLEPLGYQVGFDSATKDITIYEPGVQVPVNPPVQLPAETAVLKSKFKTDVPLLAPNPITKTYESQKRGETYSGTFTGVEFENLPSNCKQSIRLSEINTIYKDIGYWDAKDGSSSYIVPKNTIVKSHSKSYRGEDRVFSLELMKTEFPNEYSINSARYSDGDFVCMG